MKQTYNTLVNEGIDFIEIISLVIKFKMNLAKLFDQSHRSPFYWLQQNRFVSWSIMGKYSELGIHCMASYADPVNITTTDDKSEGLHVYSVA